jgi:hypothetical protein
VEAVAAATQQQAGICSTGSAKRAPGSGESLLGSLSVKECASQQEAARTVQRSGTLEPYLWRGKRVCKLENLESTTTVVSTITST